MATKKIHQIVNFEGGLNNNTDRKDVADNELSRARDVMVDSVGRLRIMGGVVFDPDLPNTIDTFFITNQMSEAIVPGYGTYIFSSTWTRATEASGQTPMSGAIPTTGAKYLISAIGWISNSYYGRTAINVHELGNTDYSANGIAKIMTIGAESTSTDLMASSVDFFEADGNLRVFRTSFTDSETMHSILLYMNRPRIKANPYILNTWAVAPGSPQPLPVQYISVSYPDPDFPDAAQQYHMNIHLEVADTFDAVDVVGEGWKKEWEFAVSIVHDGNQESPLSVNNFIVDASDQGDDTPQGEISIEYVDGPAMEVFIRVTAFNIYMREVGTTDFFFQFSVDLHDGAKNPETGVTHPIYNNNQTLCFVNVLYSAPRTESTYFSRTGIAQDTGTYGLSAEFKTAVVANGRTYIGNVRYRPKSLSSVAPGSMDEAQMIAKKDGMIKSPLHQYDIFTEERLIETASGQGGEIVKLAVYADRLLQFRENALVIYNISQDTEMVEEVFDFKGVLHPSAVCNTANGIFWANEYGCHLFDGTAVIDLFSHKGWRTISADSWSSFYTTKTITGYYPKGDYVVIVKDASGSTNGEVMIYHMLTKSFTEGRNRVTANAKISNLHTDEITGDLIFNSDFEQVYTQEGIGGNSVVRSLWKWSDAGTDSQALDVQTKMIDFGSPARKKKIRKIYITHRNSLANRIKLRGEIQAKSGTDQSPGSTSDNFLVGTFVPSSVAANWITQEFSMPTTDEGGDALDFNSVYAIRLYIESNTTQSTGVEDGETFHIITAAEAVYTYNENNTKSLIPSFTEQLANDNIVPGEAVAALILRLPSSTIGTCTYVQLDKSKGILSGSITGTLDLKKGIVKAKATVQTNADDTIIIAYTYGTGAVPGSFEINDISIVYQEKRIA